MIGLARLLSGTSTAFSRGSKGLSIHLHCTYQLATTETNKISAKNSDSVDVTMMYEMLCKHSRTFRDCTLLFQMATKKTYSKTDVMHEPSKFKQNAYIQPKQMDNTPSLLHPLPNPLSFPTPLFSLLPPSLPPPSLPPSISPQTHPPTRLVLWNRCRHHNSSEMERLIMQCSPREKNEKAALHYKNSKNK